MCFTVQPLTLLLWTVQPKFHSSQESAVFINVYLLCTTGVPELDYDDKFKLPQQILAGGSLTLEVNLTGVPVPVTDWYFNDCPVTSSASTNISCTSSSTTLNVQDVSVDNAGIYMVKVHNIAGIKTASFDIRVLGMYCLSGFTCKEVRSCGCYNTKISARGCFVFTRIQQFYCASPTHCFYMHVSTHFLWGVSHIVVLTLTLKFKVIWLLRHFRLYSL